MGLLSVDGDIFQRRVADALPALNPAGGSGLIVTDTGFLFPDSFSTALHQAMAGRFAVASQKFRELTGRPLRSRIVELGTEGGSSAGPTEIVTNEEAEVFRQYAQLLIAGLNQNSWGERVALRDMQLRMGTTSHPLTTDNGAHVDASYMTITLTLLGTGTQFPTPRGLVTTRAGQTVIFNGGDTGTNDNVGTRNQRYPNQPAPLHQSPAVAEDRLVLIIRLRRAD